MENCYGLCTLLAKDIPQCLCIEFLDVLDKNILICEGD